jgi:hypothetical protein
VKSSNCRTRSAAELTEAAAIAERPAPRVAYSAWVPTAERRSAPRHVPPPKPSAPRSTARRSPTRRRSWRSGMRVAAAPGVDEE